VIVVDTGPLVAAAAGGGGDHERCSELLDRVEQLLTVVACASPGRTQPV